jgi:cytochrome c nitrite reductase small subunit
MASARASSTDPPNHPPNDPPKNSPNDPTSSVPPAGPSRRERFFTTIILGLFGVAFGLGLFTFTYAKGFSYLSNDPASCVNCHIMREQYEGWSHSSHKAVATCNDCHTPHRFPDKWVIKGVNGWNHSVAFTTGNFPEPIRIRGFNARIAQENCVDCHTTTVTEMHLFTSDEELDCVACHGNVGHNNAAPITTMPDFSAPNAAAAGIAQPGKASAATQPQNAPDHVSASKTANASASGEEGTAP